VSAALSPLITMHRCSALLCFASSENTRCVCGVPGLGRVLQRTALQRCLSDFFLCAGRVALHRCLPVVLQAGRRAPASTVTASALPVLARRASGAACSTSGSALHSARYSTFAAGASLGHSGQALAAGWQAADFAGGSTLQADR